MDFSRIAGIAGGHAEARAVQIALKLGLFERLNDYALPADALAAAIGGDSRATDILANALTAIGLLAKIDGRFHLDDSARRFLVESSPEYLGGMILFDAALWDEWGRLEDSIRSGAPARTPDMFQSSPAATARFIRAMDSLVRARGDDRWTAEKLDLGSARTIADLGGGPGTYLVEFVRHHPNLREWPMVLLGNLGGKLKTNGRYLQFPAYATKNHRTTASLYCTLLHAAGKPRDQFGVADLALKDIPQSGPLNELLA